MDSDLIQDMIKELSKFRNNEYKKTNYKPSNTIIYIKKKKNPNSETLDLKNFKSKVSGTLYKYRSKNLTEDVINFGNDLYNNKSKNIFNLVDDNTIQITWRQLSVEERCKKIVNFFDIKNKDNNTKYGENKYLPDLIKTILQLTNDKKILYKKQIIYDQINNWVISMPCVKYSENDKCYKYTVEKKKKKKKSAKELFK